MMWKLWFKKCFENTYLKYSLCKKCVWHYISNNVFSKAKKHKTLPAASSSFQFTFSPSSYSSSLCFFFPFCYFFLLFALLYLASCALIQNEMTSKKTYLYLHFFLWFIWPHVVPLIQNEMTIDKWKDLSLSSLFKLLQMVTWRRVSYYIF